MKRRTTITVERPEGFYHGLFQRAETWEIRVDEVRRPWGRAFEVIAILMGVHIPEVYDFDGNLQAVHTQEIPGVRVPADGSTEYKSLAQARGRARSLAAVLSGMLRPVFHEESDGRTRPETRHQRRK